MFNMSSTAKRLAKGSALRTVEFFTTALITLAMTPFIIHSLGDEVYGLWIFVGSFLGYYGLMDFGLNSAVQRFLSCAMGKKSAEEANKVINTALGIFAVIGFMALIVSLVIAFALPVLIKNITEVDLFRKIILVLGLNFAIGFPLRVFSGILSANIRYDLITAIGLVKVLVRTLLIIIFLKNGHGIMALAFITFATDISAYVTKYFIVRNLYKYIVFSRALIDKSLMKPLFEYSTYTFITMIADQLRFNIDNIVIAMFIGLGSVTLYSIASRLVKYFKDFIASAVGVLTPLFSQYEARKDYHSIREKFIITTKISSYLSIMVGGILIIFGKAFIERWVGIKYIDAYSILLVLVIPMACALMQNPSIQLLFGISKHKFYMVSNSIEGIVNLILSLSLVKRYGILGVALGTAIPMIFIKLFVQPVYTCRVIKLGVRKYYLEAVLQPILNSMAIFMVFWLVLKDCIVPNYLILMALISTVIVLFICCIFFLGFKRVEWNYFKKIIFDTKGSR
ncbi:MAG: oligosaccharide flippase family protein [Candidatus Omnitrophica bacterium]|nr:oligosaccharide flippase family protein [Candidatus Omnitrophota bacterium]